MFRAGAVAETVAVTAVDIDHEEIAGTATVTVAALWPRVYEELWGEVRAENLAVMRTFRDTVMADREWGRNAIALLYDNSAEFAVLLTEVEEEPSSIEPQLNELAHPANERSRAVTSPQYTASSRRGSPLV